MVGVVGFPVFGEPILEECISYILPHQQFRYLRLAMVSHGAAPFNGSAPLLADVFVIVRCLVCEVLIVSLISRSSSWRLPALPQGFCDPLCLDGYHPNVSLIPCFAGKLATLWECLGDPCPAPSLIQYAAPVTCKEGPLIQHDGTCTPNCAEGYESTETWKDAAGGKRLNDFGDCKRTMH